MNTKWLIQSSNWCGYYDFEKYGFRKEFDQLVSVFKTRLSSEIETYYESEQRVNLLYRLLKSYDERLTLFDQLWVLSVSKFAVEKDRVLYFSDINSKYYVLEEFNKITLEIIVCLKKKYAERTFIYFLIFILSFVVGYKVSKFLG